MSSYLRQNQTRRCLTTCSLQDVRSHTVLVDAARAQHRDEARTRSSSLDQSEAWAQKQHSTIAGAVARGAKERADADMFSSDLDTRGEMRRALGAMSERGQIPRIMPCVIGQKHQHHQEMKKRVRNLCRRLR
jgi:hypothetical protein